MGRWLAFGEPVFEGVDETDDAVLGEIRAYRRAGRPRREYLLSRRLLDQGKQPFGHVRWHLQTVHEDVGWQMQ